MFWRILVIVLLVAIAVGVVVQYTVTDSELVTIAEIRARGNPRGAIALKGTIIYANDNRFILDDGTGKVELSTCPAWYKRIDMHSGDQVMVIGEVMRNPSFAMRSEFVFSVYKVFKDGDVILVRQRPGKPPWSSYHLPENQPGY